MFFYLLPPPFVSIPFLFCFCSLLVTSPSLILDGNAWIHSLHEFAFLLILHVFLTSLPSISLHQHNYHLHLSAPHQGSFWLYFFFASTPLNYLSPHKSSIFLLGLKESFPTIFKHLHFVPLLLAAGSKPNTSRAWTPIVGSSCLEFRQHYTKASTTSYTLKKSVPEDLSWSCYAGTSTQYMQT